MRRPSIAICLISCLNLFGQETIVLSNQKLLKSTEETIPQRDVVDTVDGIEVTYHFEKAQIQNDPLYKTATFIKIDGFGQNQQLAEPSFPVRWDMFAIPYNQDYTVDVLDSTYIDIPMELSPARPPLPMDGTANYTMDNVKPIAEYEGFLPQSFLPSSTTLNYRGQKLLRICLNPVKYDNSRHIVRFCTDIKYKITYKKGSKKSSPKLAQFLTGTDKYLENLILNRPYSNVEKANSSITTLSPDGVLIVSVSEYETAINKLAEWKRTLGYEVHTAVRESWSNTNEVWNAIHSYYEQYSNLRFLILLGDCYDIPSYEGSGSHLTDLYYGIQEDQTDFVPDLFRGRISVRTAQEAINVVNKIREYEQRPPSFTNFGIQCATFLDQSGWNGYEGARSILTSEEIRNVLQNDYGKSIGRVYRKSNYQPTHWNNGLYANGGVIPSELQNISWNGSTSDITEAINSGVNYILYISHSDETSWASPSFTQSDITSLIERADNAYPVIFSIGCSTGAFHFSSSFAEAFLRQPNKGCVGIFANTNYSFFGHAEALAEGMFFSIWPNTNLIPTFPNISTPTYNPLPLPVYRLGEIMDSGIMRLWDTYPMDRYQEEIIHCFGDPTMNFNTEVPSQFEDVTLSWNYNITNIDTNGETANYIFHNTVNKQTSIHQGTNFIYNGDGENMKICIAAHNKAPIVLVVDQNVFYIQDEIMENNREFSADLIRIGSNVSNKKESGAVTISSGKTTLKASEIEILGELSVKLGAELELLPPD